MNQSQFPVAALVERAMALIQRGDLAGAEAVLSAILERKATQPDALQLRGYLRQLNGRWGEAIELYRASLKANNNQPPVHNNLGLALAATGAPADAEKSYRRAIALDPSYASAACNLAALLIDSGRLDEAEQALAAALKQTPDAARALELMGAVLVRKGQGQAALAFARRAAQLAPSSHTAHYNAGLACIAAGDFEAARDALSEAVRLAPNADAAWASLGYAEALSGRTERALEAFRRAIALNPSNADAHRLLNDQIWQSEAPGYLHSYQAAIASRPADARLRLDYADRLMELQQHEAARAELNEALRAAPDDPRTRDALARAAAAAGDYEEGLTHHKRAFELAPHDATVARNYIETLLKSGQAGAAIDIGRIARARFPLDQGVLAFHSTALQMCGDPEHDRIADYAALPKAFQIETPEGYPDVETFNAALAARLRELHTMKRNPTEQTLRGGTQTPGSLFSRDEPIFRQLEQQFRKVVAAYIAGMPEVPGHPFLGRKTSAFGFSGSWSVCLKSKGFHTNHFHPGGWISSAYYVEVPQEVSAEDGHPGWLKMGETHMALPGEAIHRFERPGVGRLILFPSYFWHGTVPFEANADRLTVAFDVVSA